MPFEWHFRLLHCCPWAPNQLQLQSNQRRGKAHKASTHLLHLSSQQLPRLGDSKPLLLLFCETLSKPFQKIHRTTKVKLRKHFVINNSVQLCSLQATCEMPIMKKIDKNQEGLPNLQFTANYEVQNCDWVMSVHDLILVLVGKRHSVHTNIALLRI